MVCCTFTALQAIYSEALCDTLSDRCIVAPEDSVSIYMHMFCTRYVSWICLLYGDRASLHTPTEQLITSVHALKAAAVDSSSSSSVPLT